eukprot:7387657-Prymnesium_polylepis.2
MHGQCMARMQGPNAWLECQAWLYTWQRFRMALKRKAASKSVGARDLALDARSHRIHSECMRSGFDRPQS